MDELTFSFGTKVHCVDDTYGALGKIAVNPKTLEVVDLIVENGLLLKRSRVVPLKLVSSITEDGIFLTAYQDEMAQLQEYREVKTERPADTSGQPTVNFDSTLSTTPIVPMVTEVVREGISPAMKVLSAHTAVQGEDGTVGKVHGVNVWSADCKVSGIVSRQGVLFPETDTIPIHEIETFDDEVVSLRPSQRPAQVVSG